MSPSAGGDGGRERVGKGNELKALRKRRASHADCTHREGPGKPGGSRELSWQGPSNWPLSTGPWAFVGLGAPKRRRQPGDSLIEGDPGPPLERFPCLPGVKPMRRGQLLDQKSSDYRLST